jgi:hypothetical protein
LSEQLQEVALTEEEKNTILSYCGPEPLLVGGQALAFWAVWFKIESPAELGDKITTDADFIGSRTNAGTLNKQLRWTMWTPSLDDSTPQTAKLTKRVDNNGVKQIDFLHSIVGLDTKEIRKRSVAITLPPSSKISILHPVDVLTSRLKNLQHLPEKQNEVGVAQAHLAIKITSAFLGTLLATPHRRELLTWVEHVAGIALDKSLGNTLDRYGLDPLKSIPVGDIEVSEFKTKRWPQLIETARVARESRANKAAQLESRRREVVRTRRGLYGRQKC